MNLIKCLNSFKYAFNGLRLVLSENNAKAHLMATILVLLLSVFLSLEVQEWLWILASIAAVWIAETFNTALEKLTNLVSPEYHPLAGEAKDLAAGAVLLASVFSVAVALLIFIPKFLQLSGNVI